MSLLYAQIVSIAFSIAFMGVGLIGIILGYVPFLCPKHKGVFTFT